MNPTRALIEAAEAMLLGTAHEGEHIDEQNHGICLRCLLTFDERKETLYKAISSAKAAEEGVETRWIDCEQGYPAMETKCLVLTTEPSVEIATMGMLEYWWMHKNYLRPDQVTHYLPIPAQPTEVREKEGTDGQ